MIVTVYKINTYINNILKWVGLFEIKIIHLTSQYTIHVIGGIVILENIAFIFPTLL